MTYPAMTIEEMRSVFDEAWEYDWTIEATDDNCKALLKRYVAPVPYTRETMFTEMLMGRPVVVTGFPAPLQPSFASIPSDELGPAIMNWLADWNQSEPHRVFTGPTGVRRDLTMPQVAKKWSENRTRFGVTDLHIRDTPMEEVVAPDVLSGFNLLCTSTEGVQAQEMYSYVISSRGHVTDSHSDDPDSTNYCFTGKKLWLAWDTYEGAKAGLQDVERVPVVRKAKFNFDDWLSLPSARWFLVELGQTLFLPAHLTHKVVTLERYIGTGGFFLSLPNSFRLMTHWLVHGPLWSKRDADGERDHLLSEVSETIRDTILRAPRTSRKQQQVLGYDFLRQAAEEFIRSCPKRHMRILAGDPRFRCFADVVEAPWPWSKNRLAA